MCNTQVWVCVTGHTYILHRCSHVCECAWRRGENAVTAHAVIVLERRGRTRPALSEGTLSLVLYASLVTSAISLYIAAHQRLCCHYQRLTWLLEWFIIRQGCRDTSGIIKRWLCCYFHWIFRFISGLSATQLLKGASVSPSAFRWNAPLYISMLVVINVEDLILVVVPRAKLGLHISWLIYLLHLSICLSLFSWLISKRFSLWGQLPGSRR